MFTMTANEIKHLPAANREERERRLALLCATRTATVQTAERRTWLAQVSRELAIVAKLVEAGAPELKVRWAFCYALNSLKMATPVFGGEPGPKEQQ